MGNVLFLWLEFISCFWHLPRACTFLKPFSTTLITVAILFLLLEVVSRSRAGTRSDLPLYPPLCTQETAPKRPKEGLPKEEGSRERKLESSRIASEMVLVFLTQAPFPG